MNGIRIRIGGTMLDADFVKLYKELCTEYGDELAKLNGIHTSQLDDTEFIDNFVDEETVADASIDGNANVGHKDMVTLVQEKSKPTNKLLAFNKLYYELKKKYGKNTADEWMIAEYNGHLYMHDFPSSTYFSYCFSGDTKIFTKDGIRRLDEIVGQPIKVLNKNHGWEDGTVEYFGKQPMRLLTIERYGVTKNIKVTGNHKWFVKDKKSGKTNIVCTDELEEGMRIPYNTSNVWTVVSPSPFGVAHGFVTGDGYKCDNPRANFCGDKIALLPYFTPADIVGTEKEYNVAGIPKYFNSLPSLKETSSYLYGWLSGYFAADGCVDTKGRCTITSVNRENLEYVRDVLCVLGMPVNEIRYQDRISNLTGEESRIYVLSLSEEYLKDDFFIRPQHKERITKARLGRCDRKDRAWIVKSVVNIGTVEDCYCAVVPGTESFTLDNNVLTHNCFAYDLKDLAEKGLYFLDNFNAEPAKHLTTFIDFLKEFISFAENRTSGACGLPNLIPYLYYFWDRDVKNGYYTKSPEVYAKQAIQRFIYAINQPYTRDGIQSAFTNTSIFDRPYLEALFGGATFPDGAFMIDEIEGIMEFQKLFMETMSEIRSHNMFTFPVNSISLLRKNGKFEDEEFAKWACRHNMKWNDSNFFVDDSVTSLSNCCRLKSNIEDLGCAKVPDYPFAA